MATSDSRQRRAFAPQPSHSAIDITTHTTNPSDSTDSPARFLPTLIRRWRRARNDPNAHFAQRAGMRVLDVSVTSLALFAVPACIQHLVRALDTTYDAVGRRARTPGDEGNWRRFLVGAGILAAWHVVLIALSFKALGEDGQSTRRSRNRWNRILGRIVVPAYLVVALIAFLYTLATRLAAPLVISTDAFAQRPTPHE